MRLCANSRDFTEGNLTASDAGPSDLRSGNLPPSGQVTQT